MAITARIVAALLVLALFAAGCASPSTTATPVDGLVVTTWPAGPESTPAAAPADTPAATSGPPAAMTPATGAPPGSSAVVASCDLPPREVRVAQLVLVGIRGTEPTDASAELVRAGIGGVVLLGANVESAGQVAALVAALQAIAPVPLAIAIDEEPGRIGRLARAGIIAPAPTARDLGRRSATIVRAEGRRIGEALAGLGLTVDLAPVLDVTGAAAAGVVGDRSFGASPTVVTRAGRSFLAGLTDAGITGVAKHFPGHGETTVDSHTSLPKVTASLAALRTRALPPFVAAIADGVPAVMVGHLLVPALDAKRPASLSRPVIQGLLRGDLGFDGLVMADDLNMAALDRWGDLPRRTELAIAAGVDMAIVLDDRAVGGIVAELLDAVAVGRLPEARVNEAFLRVARFKGLSGYEGCATP